MQTFLPYQDYILTAEVLDDRRLGKQRVECKQILLALAPNSTSGWRNHPAVRMWKGYEYNLAFYGHCICMAWQSRGYKDTLLDYFRNIWINENSSYIKPAWLNEEFCSRHRAALLAKNPEHYKKFGWQEEPKVDYIWPK